LVFLYYRTLYEDVKKKKCREALKGGVMWVWIPKKRRPADVVYQNILASHQTTKAKTYVCQEVNRIPRILKKSPQKTIAAALRASASYRADVASSMILSF